MTTLFRATARWETTAVVPLTGNHQNQQEEKCRFDKMQVKKLVLKSILLLMELRTN